MSKVLVYTSPARGHLYPITPTLDELRSRGHDVAVRTLSSQVKLIRERGFDAEPISAAVESIEHDDYRARTAQGAIKRAVTQFAHRAEHEVPDVRAAIAEEEPDLLLVDAQSWGGLAAAEAWDGPWAAWLPYPMPLPSADVPPFGPGLPPARGPAGRMRDRLLRPVLTGGFERAMLPPLNDVRSGLGLAPLAGAGELFTRPPLLLYMTAPPFEYPRSDWPASIRMIGPGAWDPPAQEPEWLDGIERPIVLVTTSSEFQDDGRVVATALEALADEPVHVVATVPSADPAAFDARANAHVLPFVPHGPLLKRAACAITHGGMGATQKALAAGVPVCAVPFGRDQLEVARRVVVSDAGTRLAARRLAPDRLRASVRKAMEKREGAQRVAEAFGRAGGAPAGADALESLLAPPVPA
jgi:UDP:flavonoid glycosyltransferase YjiC (YdhE family)